VAEKTLLLKFRHAEEDLMSLACDDVGQGKPVVLLHAFPLARAMWRPQVEALAGACRLILPDLPGFGDSPLGSAPSVETMADAVAELLDAKGIREPVILGGLSMGGYVAFAFVRQHAGRLRGLILADTRAEPDDETAKANRDKMIGFASTNPASAVIEQMLPRLLGQRTMKENSAVVDEVRRIGSAQRPAGIIAALQGLRNRPDSTPTLAQVAVPALVIVGEDDVLTPPALSKDMAARLARSTLVVIEKAGHLSNLEQPAAFNAAVKVFLGCTKEG
jgi:pimeloyl-ACP methyl ester carboxylesterase